MKHFSEINDVILNIFNQSSISRVLLWIIPCHLCMEGHLKLRLQSLKFNIMSFTEKKTILIIVLPRTPGHYFERWSYHLLLIILIWSKFFYPSRLPCSTPTTPSLFLSVSKDVNQLLLMVYSFNIDKEFYIVAEVNPRKVFLKSA